MQFDILRLHSVSLVWMWREAYWMAETTANVLRNSECCFGMVCKGVWGEGEEFNGWNDCVCIEIFWILCLHDLQGSLFWFVCCCCFWGVNGWNDCKCMEMFLILCLHCLQEGFFLGGGGVGGGMNHVRSEVSNAPDSLQQSLFIRIDGLLSVVSWIWELVLYKAMYTVTLKNEIRQKKTKEQKGWTGPLGYTSAWHAKLCLPFCV